MARYYPRHSELAQQHSQRLEIAFALIIATAVEAKSLCLASRFPNFWNFFPESDCAQTASTP